MRGCIKYIFLFGLLMTLNANVFGQFYIDASTIPYEREVNNTCISSPSEVSPSGDYQPGIVLYLRMTYEDNIIISNFIDGTGSYEGATGDIEASFTNGTPNYIDDCTWEFNKKYYLVRMIDDYKYTVTLTEHVTVFHDIHMPYKNYELPDVYLYGEVPDVIPAADISDLEECETDIDYPCGDIKKVVMTYEDELFSEETPFITYKRTYTLASLCSGKDFAKVFRYFHVGLILSSTPVMNTVYYREDEFPEPCASLDELREAGANIKFPLKYEKDLIIEQYDETHPVINGAIRRVYTVTNPYAEEDGTYRSVMLYQTLIKIPDTDVTFYLKYENADLSNGNKAKLYIGTSPWDQGPEGYTLNPWYWYYVNLKRVKDGEIVSERDYFLQQDKYECIDCGTSNRVYEFLVDDELDGGKYLVEVRSKNAVGGLPEDFVVFHGDVVVGQMKMKLYANPVGIMMKQGWWDSGLYVATIASHLINLDDNFKPVYSGYCSEITYDNVQAKNHPYTLCDHQYFPFTYTWEHRGGERMLEIPSYDPYSQFGINFDFYYKNFNYSVFGEHPDIFLTKNARNVSFSGQSDDNPDLVLMSDIRDITWKALTCSEDPNEIVGPEGYGDDRMIAAADRINYKIYFENDTSATSAAARVVIHCPLHRQADSTTVRLGQFGFGDYSFEVPAMSAYYNNRITETIDSLGVCVDVTAGIDVDKNEMYWIFQSIDPETGVAPVDSIGFLPVNDTLIGNGEGFVTFSVAALNSTATGDTIAEQATIIFDENDAMATNVYTNIFDAVAPASVMVCDTMTAMTDHTLKFKAVATDDEDGSGPQYVNLFVNVDNTQYVFASRMESDTALYADSVFTSYKLGQGSVYSFVAQATDNVGNVETFKTTPDYVYVNKFPPTDMFLTNRYFNEGDTVMTKIGDFYTIDDQSTDDFKYALVAGEGDTDNDKFSIDSCFLRTNHDFRCRDMFDFEIRVQCTDNSGATFEKVFQLHAKETETPPVTMVDTTICFGESIMFGGNLISDVGYYVDSLQTVRGCDSVVMLSLNHYPELVHFDLDTTHCIYEDFDIPGFRLSWDSISQRLTKWTETSDTLLVYQYDSINANGCADVMNLNMHVYPQERDYHHVYACYNGMPFLYGDTLFTEAGIKDVHFRSKVTGCDSVVTVELEVNPVYVNIPLDTTICSNEVFELFGQQFTEPGEYKVYGETAIHHCDSIVLLNLDVKPISEKYFDYSVCRADLPQTYEGFEITDDMQSGSYTRTLVSANECDSVITLDLTVRESAAQLNDYENGWHWYSTFLDFGEEGALESLKTELGDKGLQIKSQSSGFLTYSGGVWAGSLTGIANEQMYMVKTSDSVELTQNYCYTEGCEHPITIRNGWNHIGYVSRFANYTASSLATIEPRDGDIIKSYDQGFAAYYEILGGWFGSLTQMQPGVGYMYYSNNESDATLVYPSPAKAQGRQLKMLPTHWNVTNHNFADNMTFIGKITIDNLPATTEELEVGVFCNGEVRGGGRAILMEGLGTYRLFIQVYGDNGDELTFSLFDHERGREHDAKCFQKVYFAANANYGTVHDPYAFKFYTEYNGIEEDEDMSHELTLVPNPAKSSQKVLLYCDFTPEEMSGLVVEVFNGLGVKIQQHEPTRFPVQLDEIENAGTYMVRVTTGTGRVLTKKLVTTR